MNMKGGFPPEAVAPVIWMTGLPGAGKTTTANALAERLLEDGAKAIVLDGDALRSGLCADLGFSDADRMENIRRFAHVAKLFQREGYVVIVATISPLQAHRDLARSIVGEGFFETYVATPFDVCRSRDPKGMYARAEQGRLMQFTGVSGVYEPPVAPDISIDTTERSVAFSLAEVMAQLARVSALPAPLADRAQAGGATHLVEELVAAIWADVLGLASVPVDQDFFALGGHSLRATSAIARLRVALRKELPLALLYRHPSVRELSAAIVAGGACVPDAGGAQDGAPPRLSRDGPLPLSPAQERLWFLHRLEPDSPFYTIVLAAWLDGRVERAALERAVAVVVERHEILRSHIVDIDGRPAQTPARADLPLPIRVVDLTGAADPQAEALALARAEALRPFDLARALPFRVLLAPTRADRALALILMDHAAADGWSIGIFAQELLGAYDALVDGAAPALPPLLPPMPQSAPLPPAAQPGSSLPNDNAPMSPTPTPDAPAAGGSN